MSKESLFNLIRCEDVVLWAGAGFSKYAGYPLANELRDIFYSKLSSDEQSVIDKNASLSDLTEEFVRLKSGSKNQMIQVLRDIYGKTPDTVINHQILARIPHINSIITTNYDPLFELAYAHKLNKIITDSDVAYWDKKKVNLLKIHGDLSKPDSVILTKSDYTKFYNLDKASPLWATLIEKLTTKTILFIGYGYEDSNIWAIFDHVAKYLTDHQKEIFFVSRGLPDHKINFLARNGIEYIKSTVEDFFTDLLKNIKENILTDFPERVSPETYRKFLKDHNILPGIVADQDGYKVKSFESASEDPLTGNMRFNYNENGDYPKLHKAFFESNDLLELKLHENYLKNFVMEIQGLKLFAANEIKQISIKKTPNIYEFDLIFLKQGFELNKLKAEVYFGRPIVFKVKIHNLSLEIKLTITGNTEGDTKFNMVTGKIYGSVKEQLEVYHFIKYFFSKEEFAIVMNGKQIFKSIAPYTDSLFLADANIFIDYFQKMQIIEKAFGVRFQNFKGITQGTLFLVNKLVKVITNEKIRSDANEVKFTSPDVDASIIESLSKINELNETLTFQYNIPEEIKLHGQDFVIYYTHLDIVNATVKNIKSLQSKRSKTIRFTSRSGEMYKYYSIISLPIDEHQDEQ